MILLRVKEQMHVLIRNSVHVLVVPPSALQEQRSPPTCLCSFSLFVPFSPSLFLSLFFHKRNLTAHFDPPTKREPPFLYTTLLSNYKTTTFSTKKRD